MSPSAGIRPAAALLVLAALAVPGCSGDDEGTNAAERAPETTSPVEATEEVEPTDDERPEPGPQQSGNKASPGKEPEQPSEPEKAEAATSAETAYRDYIAAINERDGESLCALLAPSAVTKLRPPVEAGSCEESLSASIGYEDPRGYPVWERTVLNGIESVSVGNDPGTVRLTASTLTEFRDRGEPSVESDVAYLESSGGDWRLAQPTAALYRAVGRPELPPTVIAPPG